MDKDKTKAVSDIRCLPPRWTDQTKAAANANACWSFSALIVGSIPWNNEMTERGKCQLAHSTALFILTMNWNEWWTKCTCIQIVVSAECLLSISQCYLLVCSLTREERRNDDILWCQMSGCRIFPVFCLLSLPIWWWAFVSCSTKNMRCKMWRR